MDVVDKLVSVPLEIDPIAKRRTRPVTRLTVLQAFVVKEAALKEMKLQGPMELPAMIDDEKAEPRFRQSRSSRKHDRHRRRTDCGRWL